MSNVVDHYISNFNPVKDSKSKRKWNPDAKRTDKSVKYCNGCSMCWEHNNEYSKSSGSRKYGKISIYKYNNFPTYGKVRELCPTCKPVNTKPISGAKK